MVTSSRVVALSVKVWVPSRAPDKFPPCPACDEAWDALEEGAEPGAKPQERTPANGSQRVSTTPLFLRRGGARDVDAGLKYAHTALSETSSRDRQTPPSTQSAADDSGTFMVA